MGPMTEQSPRQRWNRRWAGCDGAAQERAPAGWLVQCTPLLPRDGGPRALDVACGNGRNALHLARLGFTVDAVDVSDVAVEAVRDAAAAERLEIRARRVDLEYDRLPVGAYDVVVVINYLQRDLFGALADALTSGGILVAETFTRAHAVRSGSTMNPRYRLEPGELLHSFPGLTLLRYREGVTGAGPRRRAVASIAARRRAPFKP